MWMDKQIVVNIKQTLEKVKEENHIHILYAIESGSRGWGFPSPDSDYDCRFVYVRNVDVYLTLQEPKDQIDLPVDEIYDLCGWDLKKVLLHLRRSNPIMWEWLQSPVVYEEREGVREELLHLARLYYDEKAALYHYRSLAKKKVEEISSEECGKLKHYFYALRSTLCCHYMMMHHDIPPMTLEELIQEIDLEDELIRRINSLQEIKERVDESYKVARVPEILSYIEQILEHCERYLDTLEKRRIDTNEPLDNCFRKWIKEVELND